MTVTDGRRARAHDITDLLAHLRVRLEREQRLPAERTLVSEYGVKRHTLRKALLQLRESGEIEAKNELQKLKMIRSSAAIAKDTNPLEVIELRLALEPFLARLAAIRATPSDIEKLERAACTKGLNEAGSTDLLFHSMLVKSTGNSLAIDLYALMRKVGADSRIYVPGQPKVRADAERVEQRDLEHQRIAQAIARRDPDAAEQAIREHLKIVQKSILDRINPESFRVL